jgi:hypothetical protein
MQTVDDLFAAPRFVEFEIADQRFVNIEMLEQLPRPARIFSRDHVAFAQHPQRAQRDILEVANGRGDEIKSARRERWMLFAHFVQYTAQTTLVAGRGQKEYFLHMERQPAKSSGTPPPEPKPADKKATERLSRPPKDRREITIGPTTKAGPDITLG